MNGMDALMSFRTAYLRAIAMAWIDPKFMARLTDKKQGARKAMESVPQFEWPWGDSLELFVRLEKDPQAQLVWVGDDWVWPTAKGHKDELLLRVPLDPKSAGVSDAKRALALADYYRQRPTVFGDGAWSTSNAMLRSAGGNPTLFAEALFQLAPAVGDRQFAGHAPLPNGFMPDQNGFLNLGVALLSVISRAWEYPRLIEVLLDEPAVTLQSVRGYKTPWDLEIKVENDRYARWSESAGDDKPWKPLKPHRLTLTLPTRPETQTHHPLALAAYNATGAEYPFTCCP
jgi:ribosomally synthesized peptide (two-chain TOMM family)